MGEEWLIFLSHEEALSYVLNFYLISGGRSVYIKVRYIRCQICWYSVSCLIVTDEYMSVYQKMRETLYDT